MKKELLVLGLFGALASNLFATKFVSIGTGGVMGTYYPTGGAICKLVNEQKAKTNIRCAVEATGGSVYNMNVVRNGELDFGLAQSDIVYHALNGIGKFKNNAYKDVKAVLAIYPELLALTINKESGIKKFEDIKGKKINVDIPGSGTRQTVEIVMRAKGLSLDDLALVSSLKSTEGTRLLKDKKVDGYFGMFGHPTAQIKESASTLDADLIAIDGPEINELIKQYPFYAKGIISGKFYDGITHDTPSIGVKAVLVADVSLDEKVVYEVVKAIMDNFERFKKIHPAYKTITKESMLEGITAPLHNGAKKYFKEIGLLNE